VWDRALVNTSLGEGFTMTELRSDQHQAIYFYEGLDVCSQMHIEEFESVLDGFVPLVDYLSRLIHCAYSVINADLSLESVVFFTLRFDATGRPDLHWNTPIRQLARQAGYPMKSYPSIRVCCYSSCSISWHQQNLWQPEVEHLESLQRAVERNTLKFGTLNNHRVATREIPTLNIETQDSPGEPEKTSSRLLITDDEDTQLPASARMQSLLQGQKAQMLELERKCSMLTEKLSQTQDNIELRLKGRVQVLRKKLELKWIEIVRLREVELLKSRKVLHDTQEKLNERESLLENGMGQGLIHREIEGAVISIQHHGFATVIIEAQNVAAYIKEPQQFVANKLGVDPMVFRHWHNHYNLPCCVNLSKTGTTCGISINRVDKLLDFIPGQSDRCDQHKNISTIAESMG